MPMLVYPFPDISGRLLVFLAPAAIRRRQHFLAALGVEYKVITSASELPSGASDYAAFLSMQYFGAI